MIEKDSNYVCPVCGKPFYVKPSRIKRTKFGIGCCKECSLEIKRRIAAKINPPHIPTYICQYCGKEFQSYSPNPKFCSIKCYCKSRESKVYGKGVNDLIAEDLPNIQKIREIWKGILNRCLNEEYKKKHKAYLSCEICDDWLLFSNFYKWASSHYKEGYVIDKDLLNKERGSKLYSPNTCCFIPFELNNSLTYKDDNLYNLNVGIVKTRDKYYPYLVIGDKKINLKSCHTFEEAVIERRKFKSKHLKEVFDKYKDSIDKEIYERGVEICKKLLENPFV